jgi:hypothetical protein
MLCSASPVWAVWTIGAPGDLCSSGPLEPGQRPLDLVQVLLYDRPGNLAAGWIGLGKLGPLDQLC